MSVNVGTLAEAPVGGPPPEPATLKAKALHLPRSPKVITGLVIVLVFVVLDHHRAVDRAVRPEFQRVRAEPSSLVRALARHHEPRDRTSGRSC